MPKSTILKTAAILIGLSVFILAGNSAFAQGAPIRAQIKSTAREKATAAATVKIKKENVKDRIENIREKIASKASALKVKLEAFKDKNKAEIAERVNTNLNKINQNQTERMQRHLDTMSSILDRLEARVNKPTPDIKDPAAALDAINAAKDVIASSSAAVSTQAENDYTIQVTSESRIRIDAKKQRDKLHTDLLALRKIIIDAKQTVAKAIRIAKSGPPVDTESDKEGTASGEQ